MDTISFIQLNIIIRIKYQCIGKEKIGWLFYQKSTGERLVIIEYTSAKSVCGNIISVYSTHKAAVHCVILSFFVLLILFKPLVRCCRVRHFHSKNPIYLTTPNPSTNCRKSAAHPHSCRSQTPRFTTRLH